MTSLRLQSAAVTRSAMNLNAFIERRSEQTRWPADDIDRARRLLEALRAAERTMAMLCELSDDPAMQPLLARLEGGA